MNVSHLDHLVLTVADIQTTTNFYEKVLGMKVVRFGVWSAENQSSSTR